MITWENYEEYIMMHTDGELQPREEQALMNFINQHPELKSELAAYSATHLTPDETLVYADKQLLLRPQPAKRTVAFPLWQRYSIAAGIAILICISVFKWVIPQSNNTPTAPVLVSNVNPPQVASPAQATSVTGTNTVAAGSSVSVPQVAHHENTANPKHTGINNSNYAVASVKRFAKKEKYGSKDIDDANTLTKSEMEELPAIAIQKIPVKPTALEIPSLIEVPEYDIATTDADHKRSLFGRLHLDEANRTQLKTITHLASGAVQGVSNAKQQLDENAITINIKNNSIHISL